MECWQHFLDRVLKLDRGEWLQAQLHELKKLVMTLFDDEYLSHFFWQDLSGQRAKRVSRNRFDAQRWYVEVIW